MGTRRRVRQWRLSLRESILKEPAENTDQLLVIGNEEKSADNIPVIHEVLKPRSENLVDISVKDLKENLKEEVKESEKSEKPKYGILYKKELEKVELDDLDLYIKERAEKAAAVNHPKKEISLEKTLEKEDYDIMPIKKKGRPKK